MYVFNYARGRMRPKVSFKRNRNGCNLDFSFSQTSHCTKGLRTQSSLRLNL